MIFLSPLFSQKKRIYLDYASSAPISRGALSTYLQASVKYPGNPSGLHAEALSAKKVLEDARKSVARNMNARPEEIIFTSGGTESDTLAILGILEAYMVRVSDSKKIPHMITSVIEHPAVRETMRHLLKIGKIELSEISVDSQGIIDILELKKELRPETILVSVMYANNEIGTIQPIGEIAKIIRHYKKQNNAPYPLFHTDAAQAMNYISIDMAKPGIDLLSCNGSKIYGPKGIGMLYVRTDTPIMSVMHGGGQEAGLRPGTESVALISSFAYALAETIEKLQKESDRLTILRDEGIKILEEIHRVSINGDRTNRLPNNISFSIDGISSEQLALELDAKGIAVSTKSACKMSDEEGSYVLEAISKSETDICRLYGAVRLTMGRNTKLSDIEKVSRIISSVLKKQEQFL
jgi:cysteine desulfurase